MIPTETNAPLPTHSRTAATAGASKTWLGKASTYYDQPLLKKPEWKWQIVLYFFLGGIAGGSYLVAALANLFHVKGARVLKRSGRYLSFVCIVASPIFLIWDLGRPQRFYTMLRVLKLRSVMSIGTWAITLFGLCNGLTTAHQAAHDGLLNRVPWLAHLLKALPVKLIEVPGALLGLLVASYTGVLLSSTAVPVWARAKHILGPLFLASGLSTALASLSCLLSLGRRVPKQEEVEAAMHTEREEALEALERAEIVSMFTELGLIAALFPILGPLSKPLLKGRTGLLFTGGAIGSGIVVPLLTRVAYKAARKPMPHKLMLGISLMALLGGLLLRQVWIAAGRTSADDPEATHYYNTLD